MGERRVSVRHRDIFAYLPYSLGTKSPIRNSNIAARSKLQIRRDCSISPEGDDSAEKGSRFRGNAALDRSRLPPAEKRHHILRDVQ